MNTKPTIVTVDDDPQVLNAVKRDLQSRYAAKVTMLIRGPSIEAKMSSYLIDQIARTDNIEVSKHRGDLTVDSAPGRTTFRVTLPRSLP